MATKVYVDYDDEFSDQVQEDMGNYDDYSDYSDSDEYASSTVHVQFSKVYIDSLQEIFDKLDIEANTVLRTGKLSVTGEPGDMELLQPLLFSLQAKQDEMPLILPQMMQTPFFNQLKDDTRLNYMSVIGPDNTLTMGRFRLGVLTDQLIYQLLSSHCCKGPGSRQADAVIETTLKNRYVLPSQLHQLQFYARSPPPLVPCGYVVDGTIPESPCSSENDSDSDPAVMSEEDLPTYRRETNSGSTIARSRNTSNSSGIGLCKSPSLTSKTSNGIVPPLAEPPFMRARSGSCRDRKESVYGATPFSPPPYLRPRGGSGGSFGIPPPLGNVQYDPKKWHVDIPYPKDMMIGMYGDSSYPILHWNPSLKVAFTFGSNTRGMVAEIGSREAMIPLTIRNTLTHNVAFAIRSYRQSTMFHSHIIFPKEGLQLLGPGDEWRKEMDIMNIPNSSNTEHIIVDLLVCCLEGEASWNVHRRYAVFKPSNRVEQHKVVKRLSHGVPISPGAFTNQQKDLGYTLKQIILHGLQCVVKNKLDEAEIILTQALQLPIFQRITLKAFLFVCLAVLSNKRRKNMNVENVNQVMRFVNCLDQLVQACELSPNMAMPKMVGLVKQLRKELDPQKVIKSASTSRRKGKRTGVPPSAKEVDIVGGDIAINNISLIIPGKAITTPVKVSLSTLSQDELCSSLEQSPWASMLNIVSIFCIKCTPPVDRFEVPVIASVELPHPLPPNTPLRLLHSSFMSHWEDITANPTTEVSVENTRLTVRTSYSDWLAVASLKMDVRQMIQLAVKSVFVEEPLLLQVNVYALMFNETAHGQISAFITPIEDSSSDKKIDGPTGHKLIAFPHSFKVYNSQKLRFEFKGHFKPDTDAGQSDLLYHFKVDSTHQQVIEKKVILTEKRINGKLIISSYVTSQDVWETIREINLSAINLSNSSLPVPN